MRKAHTLQPTELVDRIYLPPAGVKDRDWRQRQHFFAHKQSDARCPVYHAGSRPDVDRLLDQLEEAKPEWRRLVEVKYFQGPYR